VRVGISLLTLAPGDLGGSETYARELVRALAAVGTPLFLLVLAWIARRELWRRAVPV